MKKVIVLSLLFISLISYAIYGNREQPAQKSIFVKNAPPKKFSITAYYYGGDQGNDGNMAPIDAYPVEKLTHLIFSFCHLNGNKLQVDNRNDSLTIKHLVGLKKRNPNLKVLLALGGWGGCKTCSEAFSSEKGRQEFSASAKGLTDYFHTDGIDLDWEYPAIQGVPGHPYKPEDKQNFTALVQALRNALGKNSEISFAAGGFEDFLNNSIEWGKIAPLVDRVNLMSYDLVNGYSVRTGHHTPLYSTSKQTRSADEAIRFFKSVKFPLDKVVIGAASYGRLFNVEAESKDGLYQKGSFDHSISWKDVNLDRMKQEGYKAYWDDKAKAPYLYNPKTKKIFTYDNDRSVYLKTKYALEQGLNGIMYWQLGEDKPQDGLLDAMKKAVEDMQ